MFIGGYVEMEQEKQDRGGALHQAQRQHPRKAELVQERRFIKAPLPQNKTINKPLHDYAIQRFLRRLRCKNQVLAGIIPIRNIITDLS